MADKPEMPKPPPEPDYWYSFFVEVLRLKKLMHERRAAREAKEPPKPGEYVGSNSNGQATGRIATGNETTAAAARAGTNMGGVLGLGAGCL